MAKSETTEVAVVTPGVPSAKTTEVSQKQSEIVNEVLSETGLTAEEMQQAMRDINDATMDNVEAGEIKVSRIAIAQPGTPEVAGNENGFQAGMLFDSMNREILTTSAKPPWLLEKGVPDSDLKATHFMAVLPIFKLPNEYVLWPSKDEREQGVKNFHWKDLDAQSPRVRAGLWKPKGTWEGTGSPPVTEHINILMLGLNHINGAINTNLLIASFSRTSFRTGEKLVTSLGQHKLNGLPWWGRVYYLSTEPHKNEKNQTYYSIVFAKGPKLEEFGEISNAKNAFTLCFKQARELADKQNGRALQEMMINAAAMADDEVLSETGPAGSDSGTGDDPNF